MAPHLSDAQERGAARHPVIFVVGSSRSGTTLLSRALGLNTRIESFDELHFIDDILPVSKLNTPLSDVEARLAVRLLEDRLEHGFAPTKPTARAALGRKHGSRSNLTQHASGGELLARFLSQHASKIGVQYTCEQTPQNVLYMGELRAALPDAQFVGIVRDPRDVLLSQRRRWKRRRLGGGHSKRAAVRSWANYQPVLLSLMWSRTNRELRRAQSEDLAQVLHFEHLISDPVQVLRGACERLGVPFEQGMLHVPQIGSSVERDRPNALGFRGQAVGRWQGQLRPTDVWLCERVSGDEMMAHGYQLSGTRPTLTGLVSSVMVLPVKVALMVVLNRGTSHSLIEGIRRRFLAPRSPAI